MYVTNMYKYGYLIDSADVDISKAHSDMYQIFNNREVSGFDLSSYSHFPTH